MSSKDKSDQPPAYDPPAGRRVGAGGKAVGHTNPLIEASTVRARDEQQMQQTLQDLQFRYRIYNPDLEPEHETEMLCHCPIHQFKLRKWARVQVQEMWCKAVMYPGEKFYTDVPNASAFFSVNPYNWRVSSPFFQPINMGFSRAPFYGLPCLEPSPERYYMYLTDTIALNNRLNREAQSKIDALEPKESIWGETDQHSDKPALDEKGIPLDSQSPGGKASSKNKSKRFSFRKALGVKTADEKASSLRNAILLEEAGRWPNEPWRQIVSRYQEKVGMRRKIADLRLRSPIQYLHLLRAGYFEPIPVAWADAASNPMKFSIEAASGWRGITPHWRGFEDLAEERLYWVLNHRENTSGGVAPTRMKPDFISEMNMAMERMARASEPPPLYYSPGDTCRRQAGGGNSSSSGYSKQVLPPPFQPHDRPATGADDTMILLDVSGSMDFDPVRPFYEGYLVTRFQASPQPKNKDVAKAIVRRFTDAMMNHDHLGRTGGYDLVTFSSHARYVGKVNHENLDAMWQQHVHVGGGTRVMTGWQQVKELHFRKFAHTGATQHEVYGWQAGPETPMLRLLLLLDGEATDMDEFELDLLGLDWAHVTVFLVGVDGCPHHHRHANELQRISDVNPHVSFVDAQGNFPERFVTHELLKRHLGYDISMQEFEQMEELPAYTETA